MEKAADVKSYFRYVLWLIIFIVACLITAVIVFWPKKPYFSVNSIIPDPVNPFEISEDSAWTNWKATLAIFNPNIYPIWANEVKMDMYFADQQEKLAAIAEINKIHIYGNSGNSLIVTLKIPLYSDGNQENLIGKCIAQSEVDVRIKATIIVGITSWLDIILRNTLEESLMCGNISKSSVRVPTA